MKSEEKDAVTEDYTLHINHVLETNIGNFVDEKEIKLTEKDFVKGKYDLSALTYKKEGIVVSSAAQAVSKSEFFILLDYHFIGSNISAYICRSDCSGRTDTCYNPFCL